MKPTTHRKITRFYVINPINDRRLEQRFESQENVVIRVPNNGKVFGGVAFDIGQRGLRLTTANEFYKGMDVEIVFPNATGQIGCFGHVVWTKQKIAWNEFECGVSIDAWHGIIQGEQSWAKYRGVKPKSERRYKTR